MMMLRNNSEGYGLVSQTLHWVIVVLVFTQFVIGSIAADLPLGMQRLIWLSRHKSIGMTIFVLVILRLLWRWLNPVPRPPVQMPGYEQKLARISHGLFYVLLLCMPIAGWIHSSASNLTVSWFGLFTWPDLTGPDKYIAHLAGEIHEGLAWGLFALIGVHIAAALRHHFILRDDVLIRMLPGLRKKAGSGGSS